jgi:phosphoglucosamine mutase
MTAEVALKVGQAVAELFGMEGQPARIIIGQDTRLSSDMIAHALVAGICSAGSDAEIVGVLPTPGIAVITRTTGANAGIVVSASHNPYQDNGIKVFGSDGFKLSDAQEAQIEDMIMSEKGTGLNNARGPEIGRVRCSPHALRTYADFLKSCAPIGTTRGNGLKIILDCANGATCQVAPLVFSELGAAVEAVHVTPDGKNINFKCGSQHPEGLAQMVISHKADLGLAFDGDGDRLIAIDETGEVVAGDRVLAVCAQHLLLQSRLKNNMVVSTIMSNVGLSRALKQMGVHHRTTQVGDRYVMEAMRSAGAVLGGEDSGHMIFSEHHTTGDGILTALMLLEAIRVQSKPLSKLKTIMTVFPQILVNVSVQSKPPVHNVPEIRDAIREVEAELGESGRVLVRYSGTEPLCRVMVEGPTEEITRACCRKIADAVTRAIG